MTIRFGTDGWRAVIAKEFTFANVELVAQGIADYVNQLDTAKSGIALGYDARFMSDKFAEAIAEVLTRNGIDVFLMDRDTPTPVTAYTIRNRNLAGGIMLTASHNPPEYNGIKFIPETCHPALPDVTRKIEMFIAQRQREIESGKSPAVSVGRRGKLERIDPREAYFAQIKRIIRFDAIRKAHLKIAYDPMYASGRGYLDELLRQAGCEVTVLHSEKNPIFGGRLPDPSEKNLPELRKLVTTKGFDLGLGTDGDADRFGVVDSNGNYINANQVLTLVFNHLIKTRYASGGGSHLVARTVATTHLVDALAKKFNYEVIETPVGFKYIGEAIHARKAILGGEESGGLSIQEHIPEKDGILADLLITEMRAMTGKTLTDLLNEIYQEVGYVYSTRVDIRLTPKRKTELMTSLKDSAPKRFAGRQVINTKNLDGIQLTLGDMEWVLIRPSGTEPLIRCYMEASAKETLDEFTQAMKSLVGDQKP